MKFFDHAVDCFCLFVGTMQSSAMSSSSSASAVLQLLFPMGGLGTRFSNIGITTPKPLIHVDGKAMIFKAVSSFDGLVQRGEGRIRVRLIFIVRQEHEDQFLLRTKLAEVFAEQANVEVVFVMMLSDTRGAAETCLLAKDVLIPEAPVVIMDCDTYFRSAKYEDVLMKMALEQGDENNIAGLLVHFRSRALRYSYALVNEETGYVVRTAEKDPISDMSLIGAYAFGSGKLFVDAAEKLVASPIDPEKGVKEYYISLVFNFLLDAGRKVVAVERDDYASFGTPEELALYNEGKQSWVTE